ncbi:MAG: DUF948 domain-containing protein, partial [Spirochaetota bacterium]|nr:DUF948 domain-containing protein [Spirochaetota bacterium]
FLIRVNEILKKKEIDGIISNLHLASKNLNSLMDNSNRLVSDLSKNKVGETFAEVNKTLRNTNREIVSISKDIRALFRTTNRGMKSLFNREDGVGAVTREGVNVLKNVNELILSMRKVLKNMGDKRTPVGALLSDEELAIELRQVFKNLNQLTNDLKKNPLINKKKEYRPGPY